MFRGQRVFNALILEEGEEYLTDCEASIAASHPVSFPVSHVYDAVAAAAAAAAAHSDAAAAYAADSRHVNPVLAALIGLQTHRHPSAHQQQLQQLQQQQVEGRLRLCSKSLILDPHKPAADILKLLLRRIVFIAQLPSSSRSSRSSNSNSSWGWYSQSGVTAPAAAAGELRLLLGVADFMRVSLTVIDGRTRCVSPFTQEVAAAATTPATGPAAPGTAQPPPFSLQQPQQQRGSADSTRVFCFVLTINAAAAAAAAAAPSPVGPGSSKLLLLLLNLWRVSAGSSPLASLPQGPVLTDVETLEARQQQHQEPQQPLSPEEYAAAVQRELQQHARFSFSQLDHREQLLLPTNTGFRVSRLRPLTAQRMLLLLTPSHLYLESSPNFTNKPPKKYPIAALLHVCRRVHCLRPSGLEFIFAACSSGTGSSGGSSGSGSARNNASSNMNSAAPFAAAAAGSAAASTQHGLGVRRRRDHKVLLLQFDDLTEREKVACALEQLKPQVFMLQASDELLRCMQTRWQEGRLSSFHYLQFLNSAAGRSSSNFSAYPVFPWVLRSYGEDDTSNPLLSPAAFRDFSKPMGALNPQRLEGLLKRMKDIQVDAGGGTMPSSCEDGIPAAGPAVGGGTAGSAAAAEADLNYIYGSHYSTPAYTVHFLVRLLPECLLRLHCGRFDCTHRIFRSMQGAWAGAYSGQSTFVELPPEFYSFDVSFLCNRLAIRLTAKPAGTPLFAAAGAEDPAAVAAAAAASCTGARAAAAAAAATAAATETLGDVELPGWCEGDPALLLLLHRAALESSNCSSALHRWIDLIFGYKQTGQEARAANNVFHPLTYVDAVAASATGSCCPTGTQADSFSPGLRRLLQQLPPLVRDVQLQEFGQTPIKLFSQPHPMRLSSPPFDPSEWELAFGRSAPRHLLQLDRNRSAAASSSTAAGYSMWADTPWYLYIHHHPELLPGLLTPTPLPPSILPGPPSSAAEVAAAATAQKSRHQQPVRLGAAAERVPLKWRTPPKPEKEQQQLLQLLLEGNVLPQQQQQQQQEDRQQQQTRTASAWNAAAASRLWGRHPRSVSSANSPWRRFSAWPSSSSSSSRSVAVVSAPVPSGQQQQQQRQQQQLAVRCRWLGLSGVSCCRGWVAVLGRDGRLCCFDALEGRLLQQQQQQQQQQASLLEAAAAACQPISCYCTAIHRRVADSALSSATHLGSCRLLALGCTDGSIYLQQLPQRDLESTTIASSSSSSSSSSRGMGSYPVSAGGRREKQRVVGHLDSVLSLCYQGTESFLVSGAADATVRVWGATPAALLLQRLFDEPLSEVTATAASGSLVLAGTAAGDLLLWDLRCSSPFIWGAPQGGPHEPRGPIRACGFAEGGRITALLHTPQAAAALRRQEQLQLQQIGVERPGGAELQKSAPRGGNAAAAEAPPADLAGATDAAFPIQVWELRGSSRIPPRGHPGASVQAGSPPGVVTCGALDASGLALLAFIESPAAAGPASATAGTVCRAGLRLVDCLKKEEIWWAPLRAVGAPRYISVWPGAAAATEGLSFEGAGGGSWGPTVVAVGEAAGAVEALWV